MKGGSKGSTETPLLYLERASVVAVGQKLPGLVSQLGNFLRKLSFGGKRLLKSLCLVYSLKKQFVQLSRFDEHLVVNWVAKFKAGERCHLFVWVFLFFGEGGPALLESTHPSCTCGS